MNIEQLTADLLKRARRVRPDASKAIISYSTSMGWDATVYFRGGCEISDVDDSVTVEAAIESCLKSLMQSELAEVA